MKKDAKEEFPLGLDFFSLFVHELKSPLMSFNFQMENLAPKLQDKESQEIVQKMNKDLVRLFQFVEDGLNMKELEQDFPLNRKWRASSSILKNIQEELSEWISHKKLKITHIEPVPLQVYADIKWMRIALKNLILNAIQHSSENTVITLQTQIQNDQDFFFSVKDEGAGVPAGLKDKIFHRFQSLRLSSKTEMKGTGLGLYISKWIIEKHKGTLKLISSSDAGSIFGITLPKACKELLTKAS